MKVIVEIRVQTGLQSESIFAHSSSMEELGLIIDKSYEPVPVNPPEDGSVSFDIEREELYCIRGDIDERQIPELEKHPDVLSVYQDIQIEPFNQEFVNPIEARDLCPIPPCDCESKIPKGSLVQILNEVGVVKIWQDGFKGEDVVIGIVDGGIKAQGRVPDGTMPRVIGGWPSDWGTKAAWNNHGMMTGTDAIITAPGCELYDIRISDAGVISNALAGFDWAIRQHRQSGKDLILSNSWGIYKASLAPDYATNPNHVFTRKVIQAIGEGIIVLFAAGNCGGTCPDGRCETSGPGKSIWGANGHSQVMCVGAVNRHYHFIGYSSQGPAALHPRKPDFCSFSHFTAYSNSDSGTSAACPVAAGVAALLKNTDRSLSQAEIKFLLEDSALSIGQQGWDQHSGYGVIQPYEAYKRLSPGDQPGKEVVFQNIHAGGWLLGYAQILAQTQNPVSEIRKSLGDAKKHLVASGAFVDIDSLIDPVISDPTAANVGNLYPRFQIQLKNKTCLKKKEILVQHILNTGIQLGWGQAGSTNNIRKSDIASNLRVAKEHANALGPNVYGLSISYITKAQNKLRDVSDPVYAHTEIARAVEETYNHLAGQKCFISK